MKRTFALVLSLILILLLLAACGAPGATGTPAPTGHTEPAVSPSPVSGGETSAPTPSAPEGLYASGKFAADPDGIALEKYAYELPLTTDDETFTFWSVIWTPDYIDTDYGETPFPQEHEKRTGVNIEYVMVSGNNRAENFSVLLASDNLCDVMCQAESFYSGVFKTAIVDEGYFVNLYDYREYCPNYMYEVTRDRSDSLYEKIFVEKDLVQSFWMLRDGHYDPSGYVMNPEWLSAMGWTGEDVVTFDDLHEALTFFDAQFTDYPMTLFKTLELQSIPDWVAYDTWACVSNSLDLLYVVDGEVRYANMNENDRALMTMLNQWYSEGLIDPDWASYNGMPDCDDRFQAGELGYVCMTAGSAPADWVPVHQPLLYEGQTLHMGCETTRLGYGNAAVSAKCSNIPLVVSWLDYKYSDEGAILCSYGVEGVTWEYNEDGEMQMTEFFYNTDRIRSMLACIYCMNTTADPGLFIQYAQYRYPGGESPIRYHEFWGDIDYDGAYVWPAGITLSDDENKDVNSYAADITTYITENYLAFVDGSKSLDEWDSYVQGLESMGINDVLAIYQDAYDCYMAEKA